MMEFISAQWFLWRSRFLKPTEVMDFPQRLSEIKRVLVYFPMAIDKSRAEAIFGQIQKTLSGCILEFLLHPQSPQEVSAFLTERQATVTILAKTDFGLLRTLNREAVDRIRAKEYDMILDFTFTADWAMAWALRACGVSVLAGAFTEPRSERFHNLLIKAHDAPTFDATLFGCLAQMKTVI